MLIDLRNKNLTGKKHRKLLIWPDHRQQECRPLRRQEPLITSGTDRYVGPDHAACARRKWNGLPLLIDGC
jgi:hypothetical protein